jgi:hypothetical protein
MSATRTTNPTTTASTTHQYWRNIATMGPISRQGLVSAYRHGASPEAVRREAA